MIVFACIAPHGDMDLDESLRAAMQELGRRFEAAAPDVALVVTPHSVHVEGHFAVVTAARVWEWETDREVAAALLEAPLPILGVRRQRPGDDRVPARLGSRGSARLPAAAASSRRLARA